MQQKKIKVDHNQRQTWACDSLFVCFVQVAMLLEQAMLVVGDADGGLAHLQVRSLTKLEKLLGYAFFSALCKFPLLCLGLSPGADTVIPSGSVLERQCLV